MLLGFPGNPAVEALSFHCRGAVWSVVGEVAMPRTVRPKKKKREKNASLFAARFWSPRWPLLDGIPTPHSKQMFLPSKVEFLQASLKAHVSSSFFIFLLTTCLKQNWQKWLFPCKLGWKALESYSVTVARVLSFSKLFPPILWNINTYWQFKVAMRLKEIISIELIA